MKLLAQPIGFRLGDWLNENLEGDWAEFRAAVAFVKRSGVRHIAPGLKSFGESRRVEVITGVDHQGTSYEGLRGLLNAVGSNGRVVVFHNRLPHTFHPKVYLFRSADRAELVVGSGNLTEGGLYTNYEAGVRVTLELSEKADWKVLESIEAVLDRWGDEQSGTSTELDDARLASLMQSRLVLKEAEMAAVTTGKARAGSAGSLADDGVGSFQFEAVTVPAAPYPVRAVRAEGARRQIARRNYVMTLQNTDVGVGQTTAGTSRRSPEIFVPLKARDAEPGFWDWQDGFEEDPARPGKLDRKGVRMRVGNEVVEVNMMTWPVKRDFRLRSEALRSLGSIGDILFVQKADGTGGFEYDVAVFPFGSPEYKWMHAKCDQTVRNSKKRFGYF